MLLNTPGPDDRTTPYQRPDTLTVAVLQLQCPHFVLLSRGSCCYTIDMTVCTVAKSLGAPTETEISDQ
jgi:hypothetical protein